MRHNPFFMPDLFFTPFANVDFTESNPHPSHVEENEDGYFLSLDIPGVSKEDLKLSFENRVLLVEGERKDRAAKTIVRRKFLVPDDVDTDKIEAQLNHGVLEIALFKAEKSKPKAIPVKEAKEGGFWNLLKGSEKAESA